MNGLFKIVSITVPAVALVIFLTYHQQQEHKAEMRTESAEFDRDWNKAMAGFTKDPKEKAEYLQQAKAAQSQYSSRRIEFEDKKKAVDHLGTEMNKTVEDINKQQGRKSDSGGLLNRFDVQNGGR